MENQVVLIDTSSWIEALRSDGQASIRKKVLSLMTSGAAAWCDMVAVELWNGARGHYEKQKLAELEREIICLDTTSEVWKIAKILAQKCKKAGKTVPSADLIIAACALHHRVNIEHCDTHLEFIINTFAHVKKK